jgi:alkanesulfonate monooxygenase SsuD/methylene tetrahydromethanopterin reductase-like flavin-dependent oxidoreductase (luciferase family)
MVAAKGDRMLRLTARHADAWQTAWFGMPDERFAERRERLLVACDAEGRDPATLEVTVGVEVRGSGDEPGANLPLDAAAIADALGAWAAEGVAHVQIAVAQSTPSTFDVVLEGIRRSNR